MKRSFIKALFLTVLLMSSPTLLHAQEQESFQKLVKLPLRAGGYDSFLTLMRININESRKEEGTISFTLFGKDDSYTVYLLERFKNKTAWEKHKESVYARSTDGISPAATMNLLEETTLKEIPEIPAEDTEEIAPEENTQNSIEWFTVAPNTKTAFIEVMGKAIPKARNATGNLGYNIYQNADNPNEFIVIERWKNPEVYQTHLQNEYSIQLDKELEGLITKDTNHRKEVLKNISE